MAACSLPPATLSLAAALSSHSTSSRWSSYQPTRSTHSPTSLSPQPTQPAAPGTGGRAAQQLRGHSGGHSRNPSMAVRTGGGGGELTSAISAVNVAELAALMASKQPPTEEKERLKLSRRDMRLLRQQITSQHPALCSDSGVEEREEPPPRLDIATTNRFTSRLTSPSATNPAFFSASTLTPPPKPATASSSSAAAFTSREPSLTPRIAFSQKASGQVRRECEGDHGLRTRRDGAHPHRDTQTRRRRHSLPIPCHSRQADSPAAHRTSLRLRRVLPRGGGAVRRCSRRST